MVVSMNGFDWAKAVKEFDEAKSGVKGLVDAGVTEVPRLFVHPPQSFETSPAGDGQQPPPELPTVDLKGRRAEVVEEIRRAAGEWGFFRVVNHGVPQEKMDAVLEGARRFHELPAEEKSPLYSLDSRMAVRFNSNSALREGDPASWRDILTCAFTDDQLDPGLIPQACRREVVEYVAHMIGLRETVAELLSEALGLHPGYLSGMECMKSQAVPCLYYPVCPEPHKTFGTPRHTDAVFLNLLLQDDTGGLQVRHRGRWVDVRPMRGALIANIGDLMQIISNDKFKSVEHRVLAQRVGPRVSVGCFFSPSTRAMKKPFGPIKELVSDENPAMYKNVMFRDYIEYYKIKGEDVASALPHFKI